MRAPSKDSLLAAWLTDDGRIEGLPCEAVPDLHAYELWSVATKPAAQAAEDVKEQVQKCKMAWLKANTVKGRLLVHKVRFMLVMWALVERCSCRAVVIVPKSCLQHGRLPSDICSSASLITFDQHRSYLLGKKKRLVPSTLQQPVLIVARQTSVARCAGVVT